MDLKKLLQETRNLPPVDGKPIFQFEHIDDAIVAKFNGLRTGITTKKSANATAVDVDILESEIVGGDSVTGPHTLWASKHLQQLFSQLEAGKIFILRLASVDQKTGFKKFYFKIVEPVQSSQTDKVAEADDVPF